MRAIEDVAETVARMREFYRPREAELVLSRVECNRLIDQVVNLTRARWSDQAQQRGVFIQLKTELAENLPDIMGSEVEIRDALTNLIFNAVDAMPAGGTLTLRTRLVSSGGDITRQVQVEVADTGIGMDEETRRRRRPEGYRYLHRRALPRPHVLARHYGPRNALRRRPPSGRRDQGSVPAYPGHPADGMGPAASRGKRHSRTCRPRAQQAAAAHRSPRNARGSRPGRRNIRSRTGLGDAPGMKSRTGIATI